MRILLDACVPKRLGNDIENHEVSSVHDLGWGDLDDGPLLDAMADKFDILLTVDKGIPSQQRLDHRPFAVVIMFACSNRLDDLRPLIPDLMKLGDNIDPGQIYELGKRS